MLVTPAIRLLKIWLGCQESTARGGLLHDFFYYDWRVTKFNKSHAWVHPRIAVRNARKLVNLNKKEEDIILKHMWGSNDCTAEV